MAIEVEESELQECMNDYLGICISCEEWTECVEPDAVGYDCPGCESEGTVYGAEEALIEGLIVIV